MNHPIQRARGSLGWALAATLSCQRATPRSSPTHAPPQPAARASPPVTAASADAPPPFAAPTAPALPAPTTSSASPPAAAQPTAAQPDEPGAPAAPDPAAPQPPWGSPPGVDLQPGTTLEAYVLALSWSPSFCARAGDRGAEQCAPGAGHGFVVHGLWPQRPPCAEAASPVPEDVVREMLPVMPSRHLIEHEWQRHGSCSGMSAEGFFARTREAYSRVTIPAALRPPVSEQTLEPEALVGLFTAANPGLPRDAIALRCARGELTELRVCLDDALRFRACPGGEQRACSRGPLWLRAPL